jgi:hypothetical protein
VADCRFDRGSWGVVKEAARSRHRRGVVTLVAVGWGQPQMDHYGRVDAASSSLRKGYRYPA